MTTSHYHHGPDRPCDHCGAEGQIYHSDGLVECDDCYWDGPPKEQDHPDDGWHAYRARLYGDYDD